MFVLGPFVCSNQRHCPVKARRTLRVMRETIALLDAERSFRMRAQSVVPQLNTSFVLEDVSGP
jgi:hypothetical protein